MNNKSQTNAILLIYCHDRNGILSEITGFLAQNNGNIVDLDEHVDKEHETFFMRVEWELENFELPRELISSTFKAEFAEKYEMKWELFFSDKRPKMAIFVSKFSHCLYDILARTQSNAWNVEVPLIVSNHKDLETVAKSFGIKFVYLPIDKENKRTQEKRQIELLQTYDIDFVVLARYMQILSPEFIDGYQNRIINIHHSFLPAFPGAKPYHSAYERGVKIVGATSHYVTSDLDAGPIIEQDVVHVNHRHTVQELIRKGRDLEKIVLSRAVWNHIQRKVLVFENKTIVFD